MPDPSPAPLTPEELRELQRLESAATPGPWKYYRPSELPRDWRIARTGPAGELGPGSRDYVGRFTASHDRTRSGNGGRALEGPLEGDIALMVRLRNAAPRLFSELAALREENARLSEELIARVAQVEELKREADVSRKLLDAIYENDLTPEYGYGNKRRDGTRPEAGTRFLTPRELVRIERRRRSAPAQEAREG